MTPQVQGNWYFPDGRVVPHDAGGTTFRANRGQYEFSMLNGGQQINGSVRLFRRYSSPPGRGRFRCELPSAAEPSVNQTLYAIIGEI